MSRDSFLARDILHGTASHRRSPKQEKEFAGRIGGKLTPGSGSRDTKGDIRLKNIARIELKTTYKKSFSVTKIMLDKIEEAATGAAEVPVIVVEFGPEPYTVPRSGPRREIAVMPMWALETLLANQK